MEIALSFIMDIVVLCTLAVTIFYAVRLSNSLNAFKRNKAEFEAMVHSLSLNIQQAHDAISEMKDSSGKIGDDLQESISDAKYMVDELRQVNEVSDSLARRLEVLAQKGRQSYVQTAEDSSLEDSEFDRFDEDDIDDDQGASSRSWQSTLSVKMKRPDSEIDVAESVDKLAKNLFSIRDRDYESENENTPMDDTDEDQSFGSQAEKDLYEVLKGRNRR